MAIFDIDKYIEEQGSNEPVSSIMSPQKDGEEPDKLLDFYKRFSQGIYDAFPDKDKYNQLFRKAAPRSGVNWDEVRQYTRDADMKSAIESSIAESLGILQESPEEAQTVTLLDVTDTEEGKLSNPEPLYEMAEEGAIETEELPPEGGIMSKPEPKVGKMAAFVIPEFEVFKDPKDMSELEILARTIEAEAKGESYEGKIAVGATIANRASSGKYGKGIHGVILRRGQFSPWNRYTGYAGGEQGKDMLNYKASVDSYKAANAILTGKYEDPTDGAIHYVNEKVSKPAWLGAMKGRKRGTITIGNHLFGNADANKKYDGKSWIESREKRKTSPRPMLRPTE